MAAPLKKSDHERPELRLVEERMDPVAIQLALGLTLLLHFILIFLVPWGALLEPTGGFDVPEEKEYEVVLVDDDTRSKRFVETNPDVESEQPIEETLNEAARAQQAAQQTLPEAEEDIGPRVDGEQAWTQTLVEGDLQEKSVPVPPSEEQPPMEMTPEELAAMVQKTEPPRFIEQEALTEEGLRSRPEKSPESKDNKEPQEAEIIVDMPAELQEALEALSPKQPQPPRRPANAQQPQPRQHLTPRVVKGIQMRQLGSRKTRVDSNLAIDANFSEFAAYEQRLLEIVSMQWHMLLDGRRFSPTEAYRGNVKLRFKLDNLGNVRDLEVEETTVGSLLTALCKDAVMSRSPFGIWTQEMVAELGHEQTLKIEFHYR